jgi:hypothetical protein
MAAALVGQAKTAINFVATGGLSNVPVQVTAAGQEQSPVNVCFQVGRYQATIANLKKVASPDNIQ